MMSVLYVVTFFVIINASSYEKRCLQFLVPTAVYEYVLTYQSLALIDLDEAAKSTISTATFTP